MKYLKSDSYYSDLYDKFTVEECRRMEKFLLEMDYSKEEFKKFSEKELKRCKGAFFRVGMYFKEGEMYVDKEETIKQWRDRDVAKDLKLENAKPIKAMDCLECGEKLVYKFKELCDRNGKEEVLFLYRCPNCSLGRAFFEDGKEKRFKRELCKKCGGELNITEKEEGDLCITKLKCKNCGDERTEEFEFSFRKKYKDKDFIKDRERFCLTEEEGTRYISQKMDTEKIAKEMKEDKNKKRVKKEPVKQLKILEAQKIVIKKIEKEGYSDMKFGEPEIKKDVIVGFTVYDKKTKRDEYDSRMQLKKIIEKSLKGTNWRLMSDGIYCKLGILKGRLRGKE